MSPEFQEHDCAYFASGPEIARDIQNLPVSDGPIVLTSPDGLIAAADVADAQAATSRKVLYLEGGSATWTGELEAECRWLSEPRDLYKRPYEGTDNAEANMRSYIEWELQL